MSLHWNRLDGQLAVDTLESLLKGRCTRGAICPPYGPRLSVLGLARKDAEVRNRPERLPIAEERT